MSSSQPFKYSPEMDAELEKYDASILSPPSSTSDYAKNTSQSLASCLDKFTSDPLIIKALESNTDLTSYAETLTEQLQQAEREACLAYHNKGSDIKVRPSRSHELGVP